MLVNQEILSNQKDIKIYSQKTENAVFYAYNVTFVWGFVREAFVQTGIKDMIDFHRFDIMSMIFAKFKDQTGGVSLNNASRLLGIPEEPMPHNALNGAMQAYEVLRKL